MIGRNALLALTAGSMLSFSDLPVLPAMLHRYGEAPRREYRRWTGNHYAPNGKREVARRLRQIQNGQLKVSVT